MAANWQPHQPQFHDGKVDRAGVGKTGALDYAGAFQHLATDTADIGVVRQPPQHRIDCSLQDDRVRVQQQQSLALGGPNPLIVCPCEAEIVIIGDQHHVGKLGRDHRRRSIGAGIVDHDHLMRDPRLDRDRGQASAQQVAGVPVHDDNGDFGGGSGYHLEKFPILALR